MVTKKYNKFRYSLKQQMFLEALETGRFQQGFGVMKDGYRYDVLGVAASVCAREFTNPARAKDGTGGLDAEFCGGSHTFLPYDVVCDMHFFGPEIPIVDGAFLSDFDETRCKHHDRHINSLMEANDRGISFREMARFIREHPKRIFTHGEES